MILSNEPGYYREGAFGIRIENLLVVTRADAPPSGDAHRAMLNWRTLTYVPIDRRLIVPEMLDADAREWLNRYHADTYEKISPLVDAAARAWLAQATAPI
jgi:Xaa-Pro aminopeptidase